MFTAGGGSNYNFKLNGTSVQNGTGTTYTTTTLNNGDAVKVIVTSAGGCTDSTSVITTSVNPAPSTSSITGNATPACSAQGEIYSVDITAGSTYSWGLPSGATIVGNSTGNSITVNFAAISGDITVIETNTAGCVGTTQTLTVNLQSCALNADFISDKTTICPDDSVLFTDNSTGTTGSTSYQWNFGEGAVPASANTKGPHWVVYTTPGNKTVELTINDGPSDVEVKADYITVNALPVVSLTDETVCGNGTVIFTAQTAGDKQVEFSLDGGQSVTYTTNTSPYEYSADLIENDTILVSARATDNITGCVSGWSASATGIAYPLPVTSAIQTDHSGISEPGYLDVVCLGDEGIAYYVDKHPGSVYEWKITGFGTLTGDSSLIKVNWNTTTGDHQIWVEETNSYGCSGMPLISDILVDHPQTDLGSNQEICQGEQATFSPGNTFTSYLWSDNSTNETLTTGTGGTIGVTVTDQYGCQASDSAELTINPLPVVNLGNDTSLCGPSLRLDAGNFADYEWSTGSTGNPVTIDEGQMTVSVTVTDFNGCKGSDSIYVDVCNVNNLLGKITNTFTPNGDGAHDTWVINNIGLFPYAKIDIFDRWGRRVYHCDGGYNNDWNGTWKGKKLPMDTYYYIIDLKNGASQITGTVTIVR